MSEWTQSAGSSYLTGEFVQESGGVVRMKVSRTTSDVFDGKPKPVLEGTVDGVPRKVVVNAGNMAILVAWLKGRPESKLVGATIVCGYADVRNPRTGETGPAVRFKEVKA